MPKLKALKEMDSNKTPGSDGLPAEFYKCFGMILPTFFLAQSIMPIKQGSYQYPRSMGSLNLLRKKIRSRTSLKPGVQYLC